jgi:hypothetical protein
MARLFSSGFELNTTGTDVEWSSAFSAAITTTPIRSGTYAFQANGTGDFLEYDFVSANTADGFYFRIYVRCADYPSALADIIEIHDSTNAQASIRMNTDGTLELWNIEDGVQIGSDSSALSLNTQYCIEIKADCTTIATTALEARINGTSFASGTVNWANGIMSLRLLCDDASTDMSYDDVAINDDSGSFQNSWAGFGEVIHLLPDGGGDATAWTNTYTNVDEVTPDDATTYIESNTLDQIEEVTLAATPAALETADAINVVQVYVRFALSSATSTDPTFVLRIKSAPSGTVEESATISPTSTTWMSNAVADPRNSQLTLYDLPGASTTKWTKADLDTAQIGVRETLTDTHFVRVSSLQLIVDHTPTPTVTLNSPADASSDSDTTPTLDFTGTDPEGQDLEYNVQVDRVNTFDGLMDSYSEANQSLDISLNVPTSRIGISQSFTGNGGTLASCNFYLKKTNTPTGNAVAKIYAMSGTFGSDDNIPTGAALATSDNFDVSTLTTSYALVQLTFSGGNQITLTNGTKYVITFEYTATSTHSVQVGGDNTSPSHGGNSAYLVGSTWTAQAGVDTCFYVYSDFPLDKLSVTPDAGFTTGHPFGQMMESNTNASQTGELQGSPASPAAAWDEAWAQSFQASSSYSLGQVIFKLAKRNSPTDNIYVELCSSVGGTPLATSDNIDGSTLTTSAAEITFTFPSPAALTSGTTYYLQLRRSGVADSTNEYYVSMNASGNPYANGQAYTLTGNPASWTSQASTDLYFKTIQAIAFTVQAGDALSAGTYYWRVRALDPDGANTYGAWSSTRSFTVSALSFIAKLPYIVKQAVKRSNYY